MGKNAMTTTDPTLQAKITDEAAIARDGGPSMPANGKGILVTPGMFSADDRSVVHCSLQ